MATFSQMVRADTLYIMLSASSEGLRGSTLSDGGGESDVRQGSEATLW